MKVLIVIDKGGTAIERLAQAVKRNLPQHQIEIYPIHPKRNDVEDLVRVQKLMIWADVIDIHYWKSGQILRTTFPSEFEAKPRVLFHFNPYDAENEENKFYNKIVVGNKSINTKIPSATLIPYGVDLSFFTFNENYTNEKVVNMSVNRIEGKKGILEVAQACKELGYKFKLVGRVSKAEYMNQVMEMGKGVIEFYENASDEKLREVYRESAIHVCNSVDNFESGTLPILESMAVGVPVVTRVIGHVFDLYNGSNMVIRDTPPEDVDDLKQKLQALMENRQWRLNIRNKAWETVKNRDDRKMALDVNSVYYSVYKPEFPLISIIIPTRDHVESFVECLVGAVSQDYPKLEVVIVDSGDTPVKKIIEEARKHTSVPIKYIHFQHRKLYSLAEARNRAVIESDGEYIVLCDDRIKMSPNAVMSFHTYKRDRTWLWGVKDDAIKGFVENFSFVSRKDLIKGGMFCERVQWYGGMTQEIRERFEKQQGLDFVLIDEAKARGVRRSRSKQSRREDIIEAKYLLYKMYYKT